MNKILITVILILISSSFLFSQIAINLDGSEPDPSSMLDVKSTVHGILIPRISTLERNKIPSPANGLLIYNTNTNKFNYYNGTFWYEIKTSFSSSTIGHKSSSAGIFINTIADYSSDESAILDVNNPTRGILIPRTTPEKIAYPAVGLIIYNTSKNCINYYDGKQWVTPYAESTGITAPLGIQSVVGIVINKDSILSHHSAILDVNASDKGILIPRLTNIQRDSILPCLGLLIYNTSSNKLEFYNGTTWDQFETDPNELPNEKLTHLLPFRLINSTPLLVDEIDIVTEWTHNGASLLVDTKNQHSGSGCLELTSKASGTTVQMQKKVKWNFTEMQFNNFSIWAYLHTDLSQISQIQLLAASDYTMSDYFYRAYLSSELKKNGWVLLAGNQWTIGAGNPNYENINYFRIKVFKKDGSICDISFDMISIGYTLKPCVMIGFDDGYSTDYTAAYPILKAKHMVASSYVIKNAIGTPGKMTLEQLHELNDAGWDIANHTTNHPLTPITKDEYIAEVEQCRTYLDSQGLTRASRHVGYSASSYDANALLAIQEWGALTAKKPGNAVAIYDRITYPYIIQFMGVDATTTFDDIKKQIDMDLKTGGIASVMFHKLVANNANGYSTLLSIFEQVVEYCASLNLQSITIDEYYRLEKGPITVTHK